MAMMLGAVADTGMTGGPKMSVRRAQVMALIAAFLGWMFDGMEMGIFPLVARPALLEMQQTTGILDEGFVQRWMGYITAAFLLGAAGGGLVFGWLGDRIGRVRAMTLSILFYSIFTGLCYFATAPWQLGVLRFIAALGMGGEWSLGVALVMEVWPSRLRPLMAGIIGAAANVGFLLVGVIGFLFPITPTSWRWLFLVGATPALLTFFIRIFVPESERWKKAVEGKKVRPLAEILSPALFGRTLFATVFATVPLIVTWGIVQWIPLWTDQIAGPERPEAKGYTHSLIAIGAILGCLVAPLVGQKIGRRPAYFALCLAALISSVYLFRGLHEYTPMFVVMVFVVGFFTASFYGWLPLYLPELFPTRVRATGQGLAFNFGRILAAVGVWNMGALMAFFDKSYARAGAAIAFVYVIGMILIWLAPETKDKPLPE
jgi:MFS transporter, SHS family, sialic acid transporter